MNALTGTWRLARLALRRDRLKLPIVIIALTAVVIPSVNATIDLYGNSAQERLVYAQTMAPSVLTRAFGGPIHGPNTGEIVMNENFLFSAVAIAFISTLTVVRHTRQNEETGREELIGSAVVSRHASLVAALFVAIGTNIVLAAAMSLSFLANDMPLGGSLAAGAALGCVGIAFAAIAAVAAQISSSARGANGIAALTIGAAFLLRAMGDGFGTLSQQGTAVNSLWLSWLSPLGWGQQLHPFTMQRWGVFGLFAVFFAAAIGLAFYLTIHRDVGSGLLQPRKGPSQASASLLSPLGLAWRLQKGVLRGWAIALVILGTTYGYMGKEMSNLLEQNPQVADILKQMSGGGDIADAYLGAIMLLMGISITGYTIQSLLRLRSEESSGTLEPVLATKVSRRQWVASHLACSLGGTVILALLVGLSIGVSYVLATGADWSKGWEIGAAAFLQLPAIFVVAGVTTAVFGLMPQLTIGVGWGLLSLSVLIDQFGSLLKLPHWTINLSPYGHTPNILVEAFRFTPTLAMSAIAFVLFVLAFAAFRQRDIG